MQKKLQVWVTTAFCGEKETTNQTKQKDVTSHKKRKRAVDPKLGFRNPMKDRSEMSQDDVTGEQKSIDAFLKTLQSLLYFASLLLGLSGFFFVCSKNLQNFKNCSAEDFTSISLVAQLSASRHAGKETDFVCF